MGPNRVILGVGGGIAAYKSAELARALMQRGARSTSSHDAQRAKSLFGRSPSPLSPDAKLLPACSPPASAEDTLSSAVEHIGVAQDNDLLVVAPATADLLAKFAYGLADDFLSTLYLAFTGPVVLAPAMNTNMWQHAATQANVETLRRRGHKFVDPESGYLACGTTGPGRLAEPERIAAAVFEAAESAPRSGRRDRADYRRSHAGAARSCAIYLQPVERQDGLRAGAGRRRPGRASDPGLRPGQYRAAGRRDRYPGPHRRGDAGRRLRQSGAGHDHRKGRRRRRFPSLPRARAKK